MKCFICKTLFGDNDYVDRNRLKVVIGGKSPLTDIKTIKVQTLNGVKDKPICPTCGNFITVVHAMIRTNHPPIIFEDAD